MAKYDNITKYLIQKYTKDFIQFTTGRADILSYTILNTELRTPKTKHADSLIRVQLTDKEVLVHTEFQTTRDSTMPLRMFGYIFRAIEEHGLPVYSSVIYLRPKIGDNDPGEYTIDVSGHPLVIPYRVIRLSEIEGQLVLNAGHTGLLPFTPLMKPPKGMTPEAWLRHCIRTIEALPITDTIKVDILGYLTILSGLRHSQTTINRILSQEGLMDAIMRQSSFAKYIMKQGEEKGLEQGIKQGLEQGIEQGLEQGIEQGIEQGLEQGIEQGIEQGNRERAIGAILDVLEIRFGLSASHPLSARVSDIEDLQHLKELHREAIQVSDLDEFGRLFD